MSDKNNSNGQNSGGLESDGMIDLSDLLARISESLITFDTVESAADKSAETAELSDLATTITTDTPAPTPDSSLLRYLIVTAADKTYGLATEYVAEVMIEPVITPVPGLPDWILGVTNAHGDIASVVHLDRFLNGDSVAWGSKHPVILTHGGDQLIGLLVDEVRTIYSFPAEDIFSPPFKIETHLVPFLQGIIRNDNVIYLLDCEGLLTGKAMQQFS